MGATVVSFFWHGLGSSLTLLPMPGCAIQSRSPGVTPFPLVRIGVLRPPQFNGAAVKGRVSNWAINEFYRQLQRAIEREYRYEYSARQHSSESPEDQIGSASQQLPDALRPTLSVHLIDYVLGPRCVDVCHVTLALANIGPKVMVDGVLVRTKDMTMVWATHGSGAGSEASAIVGVDVGDYVADYIVNSLLDPQAYARKAARALLDRFPPEFTLIKADGGGVPIVCFDEDGKRLIEISTLRIILKERYMHGSSGNRVLRKLVLPRQVLIPYKEDKKWVDYSARRAYLLDGGTGKRSEA